MIKSLKQHIKFAINPFNSKTQLCNYPFYLLICNQYNKCKQTKKVKEKLDLNFGHIS
jgi:hypothetical protein